MPPEDVYEVSGSSGAPKAKRGCLGTSFLVIGIIAAVFFVLCCGAGAFVFNKFRTAIKTKPAEIQEVRDKIADIDIPAEMQPAMGMDLDFFGFFSMQMVAYGNELQVEQGADGQQQTSFRGTFLTLMQMKISGADQQELENQFRNQTGGQGPNIRVESSETRPVTIDGEEFNFQFAQGTNSEDNTKVRTVNGMFHGRGGPTLFMLVVPEDTWNEEGWNDERAIQLLESIHK